MCRTVALLKEFWILKFKSCLDSSLSFVISESRRQYYECRNQKSQLHWTITSPERREWSRNSNQNSVDECHFTAAVRAQSRRLHRKREDCHFKCSQQHAAVKLLSHNSGKCNVAFISFVCIWLWTVKYSNVVLQAEFLCEIIMERLLKENVLLIF